MSKTSKGSSKVASSSMNFVHEATYLAELENLCETMLLHAETFRRARAAWLERRAEIAKGLVARSPRGLTNTGALISESVPLQGQMWIALEGFLNAWARGSLMLFPSTPRREKEARERAESRAAHLRSIMNVEDTSMLADRDLRNQWMHIDEQLDAALEENLRVTPQRFVETMPSSSWPTMRMIVVQENRVVFRDSYDYLLDTLFEAAGELKQRVIAAKESAGERHADELSERSVLMTGSVQW